MYRSRPVVLVLLAAGAAACSSHDDSASVANLATDTTLARLSVNQEGAEPLPAACGTAAVAAKGAAKNEPEAKELARLAYSYEVLGRVQEARSLLGRAFELDGTDQSVAYHLGRTSEAIGDRDAAVSAYCHYISLASAGPGETDARQRVARLTQSQASAVASTGSVGPAPLRAPVATPVASRSTPRIATRVSRAPTGVPQRDAQSTHSVGRGMSGPADGNGDEHRSASNGDVVVATSAGVPPSAQPTPLPSTRRRGPTRVQGAGVGAVAGAIIGAATGRSVKSAILGAAAGGILGTVVAGSSR